jgi:hypothetical protein
LKSLPIGRLFLCHYCICGFGGPGGGGTFLVKCKGSGGGGGPPAGGAGKPDLELLLVVDFLLVDFFFLLLLNGLILFKTSPGGGGAGGGGGNCACAREAIKASTKANGIISRYFCQACRFGLLIVFINSALVNERGIKKSTTKKRYC